MGLSIAKELARNGSEVNLILGPSSCKINYPNVNLIPVESCDEMYIEANKFLANQIFVYFRLLSLITKSVISSVEKLRNLILLI